MNVFAGHGGKSSQLSTYYQYLQNSPAKEPSSQAYLSLFNLLQKEPAETGEENTLVGDVSTPEGLDFIESVAGIASVAFDSPADLQSAVFNRLNEVLPHLTYFFDALLYVEQSEDNHNPYTLTQKDLETLIEKLEAGETLPEIAAKAAEAIKVTEPQKFRDYLLGERAIYDQNNFPPELGTQIDSGLVGVSTVAQAMHDTLVPLDEPSRVFNPMLTPQAE
jgi:hypothetical protein